MAAWSLPVLGPELGLDPLLAAELLAATLPVLVPPLASLLLLTSPFLMTSYKEEQF